MDYQQKPQKLFWIADLIEKALKWRQFKFEPSVQQLQSLFMELQQTDRLALLPRRPRGNYLGSFRSLNVLSNHFHVNVENFEKIHIFSIHYNPKIPLDNVILRRQLLEENREKIKLYIDHPVISGNNIYSTTPPLAETFEIQAGEYKIALKQVKILNVKENPKLLLSFLNNGLRNVMRGLDYMEIGRSGKYFNTKQKTKLDNLMMFSGYKSNFVLLENGYYLRVDSAKKIVRNQTVLQNIDMVYQLHGDKSKEERRNILLSELIGKVIMTNYGKTAYYRIDDVVFEDIESIVLEDAKLTLRQYYQQKYNLKITNKKQPLLKVQGRRKNSQFQIFLIPEFCLMTGIPQNFDQFRRKQISEKTIKSPIEKQREIVSLMKQLKSDNDFTSLKQLGIKVSSQLETVKGRLIPMPKITLGQNCTVQKGKQAFFNLFDKPIYGSKHSIRCAIIYFSGVNTQELLKTFDDTSRKLKVKFETIKIKAGQYEPRRGIEQIQGCIAKAAERDGCNICLICLPKNLKQQYKKLKTMALLKHRMICQMTTQNTLGKRNLRSIATKILLQIIAKRGNTLWVPVVPTGIKGCMMVAFEVAKSGKETTLGMCATLNSTFSSIFSRTDTFGAVQKKFISMINLTLQGIEAYSHRNKEPPSEVLLFNSSTSNDQIIMFQDYFIKPLKQKLDDIYHEKTPSLTMVMINVKSSQRFFTEGAQTRNVPAGTVVSSEIVSNYYDFYVVSQSSGKGSTVPNHYRVIFSDSKIEQGILQELIFSQCFNYVNWTGSIKVPGILQYAGKCAKFNSEILENEKLSEDLQSKLYFV